MCTRLIFKIIFNNSVFILRQDEDLMQNMKKNMPSMVGDQDHNMEDQVDQVPCEDHLMDHLDMVLQWETLHSMRSTSSTMPTCSNRPSTTPSTPCSCSSTTHSMVGQEVILLNQDTCPTSLLPHLAMVQEVGHHMDIRSGQD